MSRAEWCLKRSEIFKDAAALEDDSVRKSQLLRMADQWAVVGKIELRLAGVARGTRDIDGLRVAESLAQPNR